MCGTAGPWTCRWEWDVANLVDADAEEDCVASIVGWLDVAGHELTEGPALYSWIIITPSRWV
jgi:hypothetical protein